MDKALIKQRFGKHLDSYSDTATVQRKMADNLLNKLLEFTNQRNKFERIFEFGCGSGGLTRVVADKLKFSEYILNDLVAMASAQVELKESQFLAGDIESVNWPESLDLVVSGATVQWLEDPEQVVLRCKKSLRAGGSLAFSSFAPNNLSQIVQLTGVGLEYPSAQQWQQWLEPHFKRVEVTQSVETLYFANGFEVLMHLKNSGVTGISRTRWNKTQLNEFNMQYKKLFSSENGVELTYHPLYILATLEG